LKWHSLIKWKKHKDNDSHHWEYYGRMKYASDLIKALDLADQTVLDVGGVPGENLLLRFGVRGVTTLDISKGADIVATAEFLPLKDNSFDVVTCIDTLEHIPQQFREKTLDEMIRVAVIAVIVVAPQDTVENNLAEQVVLNHCNVGFLDEHKALGLVNFERLEKKLDQYRADGLIKDYARYEMDDLLNWINMMTRDVKNGSAVYLEAYTLENRFCPRRIGLHIRL